MDERLVLIIIGMAVVTYIPRYLPLKVLTKHGIPGLFKRWLDYVPAAVLAALLAPGILVSEGTIDLSLSNNFLIAAIPSFVVAWKFQNMLLTILLGVAVIAFL